MNTISVWAIVAVVGWASAAALTVAFIGQAAKLRDRQVPRVPAQRRPVSDRVAEAKVRGYIG